MKNIFTAKLISLLLCVAMILSLAACTPGGNDTESETDSASAESESLTNKETESQTRDETTDETKDETTDETESESATEPNIEDVVYANGADVEGAGPTFEAGAFATEAHEINESAAVTKTAAEMLALLADRENVTDKGEGKVYKVTEPLVLAADTSYDGNFSALIAEGGIVIEGNDKITIENLIIKGSITIKDAKTVTLNKVDLRSSGVAITADSKSSKIEINDSMISATEAAIDTKADECFILGCVITGDRGVVSDSDELEIRHTRIKADTLGVMAAGDCCTLQNNLIESENKDAVGIDFAKGSYNGLIALNTVKGMQTSIRVTEGYNCVVLLNSAVRITAEKNTNVYVVENALGGAITLRNNSYLLCDGNTFPSDGLPHPVINTENKDYNGDGLQDLSVRPEHGANEDILPHTNKDLFLDMNRETRVRDISLDKKYKYNEYIQALAEGGGVVIVPPGVYSISETLELNEAHSGATIYAFGVYQEKKAVPNGAETPEKKVYESMGKLIEITGNDIRIHGLTFGYDFQSAGQIYVLEKYSEGGKYYIRAVTSAGYYDGFGYGDTKWFSGQATAIKGDELYGWRIRFAYQFVRREADGTMILQVTEDKKIFSKIEAGDIFGCRLEGDNNYSISLKGSNTLLKDCVLYGYSAALAVFAGGANAKGIQLERFHNTVHSSPIIDKETYDRYKALEQKYGLTSDGKDPVAEGAQGLEVYIDAERRYRGGLPRLGSVDGTHVVSAAEGLQLTSCIFEQMVDDGSNHRSNSSRIAGLYDHGDGTTTVYYKGLVARTYYSLSVTAGSKTANAIKTSNFRKGDTMFAYASDGHTLIEAAVLSNADVAGALPANVHLFHIDNNKDCICDFSGCGAKTCFDNVNNTTKAVSMDCKCDVCGKTVHTDYTPTVLLDGAGDGSCNGCGKALADSDHNGLNDSDNSYIIRDMASNVTYNASSSTLSFQIYSVKGTTPYLLTYNTQIYAVKVKTADLDLEAIEGYDLLDNDYFMENKVICDNLSLNSAGFRFDNVMYRNYHCRGILPKTVDATVKNCTFRNVACAGLLVSAEYSWGESTVPRNITIEGCLFDNTGHSYNMQSDLTYAPISISGLGEFSEDIKELSENTLPCRDIRIIGNKFDNMNNTYAITVCAAQNVTIKDNVFIGRETEFTMTKAVYLKGCLNIEISDNTYEGFGDRTLDQIIFARNYKGLHGTDIEKASIRAEGK